MRTAAVVIGALLVVVVLLDTFETVILPRQVKRRVRLTTILFALTWRPYRRFARSLRNDSWRDSVLAYFGPSTILLLLVAWAIGIIGGFALIHWGLGSHIMEASGQKGLGEDAYLSGTTFFTLGLGDVVPVSGAERAVAVLEAGLGLGFLAIVIAYIPVLYQSFSHREVFVNRLDILAGAPPTPGVILKRFSSYGTDALRGLLEDWQHWTAELMDSTQSYPVLAFYRSQHGDQSWLTALVAILDTCALIGCDPGTDFADNRDSAELAFSLASHAARDVCDVLGGRVREGLVERSEGTHHDHLLGWLHNRGLDMDEANQAARSLDRLREHYEPQVAAMSDALLIDLPAFCPECEPAPHHHAPRSNGEPAPHHH